MHDYQGVLKNFIYYTHLIRATLLRLTSITVVNFIVLCVIMIQHNTKYRSELHGKIYITVKKIKIFLSRSERSMTQPVI